MKKIYGLLCILAALFVFVGCSGGEEKTNTDAPKDDTQKQEETVALKFDTNAGYAPFEYLDKGEIVGFDVDVINAMAEAGNFTVDLKNIGWEPQFIELSNKTVDGILSSVTITPEREKEYTFSKPYYENRVVIMVNEGSAVASGKDLTADMKIGVLSGSTSQIAAEKLFGTNAANIQRYKDNPLAILALKNKEVDAVICDIAVAQLHILNNPADKMTLIDDPETFESEFYGICLQKDSQHKEMIDNALQTIIDNGKYAEIYKKWFGEEPVLDFAK